MPPNQLEYETVFTPSTARTLSLYDSGIGKTSEMALREIRRELDAAFEPAYQASTTVCSRPKATMATTRPTIVSALRSLARKMFFRTSLMKYIAAIVYRQWTATGVS